MLRAAGVAVSVAANHGTSPSRWAVTPGPITPAAHHVVEPDLSGAAVYLAAALVTGGEVTVAGWPPPPTDRSAPGRPDLQPIGAVRGVLEAFGGTVTIDDTGLTVRGDGHLAGVDVDLAEIGELTPTVTALAIIAARDGARSRLRGVAHIRGHETDRLAALAAEAAALGARVAETDDGLVVEPSATLHPTRPWGAYADHRMATAGALVGLVVPGVEIDDVTATTKTLPDFATDWPALVHGVGHRMSRPVAGTASPGAVTRGGAAGRYDESDVRVRPGRGTRPRSKRRPEHADARAAMVVGVDRGRWTCAPDDEPHVRIVAMRAREMGRTPVVVGDQVDLVGDTTGEDDTLARIVRVAERTSVLRRTADDTDPYERIVVANASHLIIVTALADPVPRTGFVDRCLVAAYAGGLTPVLCLTKADLADPGPFAGEYTELDLPIVVTRSDEDPAALRDVVTGRVSALIGHSGVGKSTLVNVLVPDAERSVGVVSGVGKGRHTSTSAVALALPGDEGWVVDTPGIRSFGLAHISPDDVVAAFGDLAAAVENCPRGCSHLGPPGRPGVRPGPPGRLGRPPGRAPRGAAPRADRAAHSRVGDLTAAMIEIRVRDRSVPAHLLHTEVDHAPVSPLHRPARAGHVTV